MKNFPSWLHLFSPSMLSLYLVCHMSILQPKHPLNYQPFVFHLQDVGYVFIVLSLQFWINAKIKLLNSQVKHSIISFDKMSIMAIFTIVSSPQPTITCSYFHVPLIMTDFGILNSSHATIEVLKPFRFFTCKTRCVHLSSVSLPSVLKLTVRGVQVLDWLCRRVTACSDTVTEKNNCSPELFSSSILRETDKQYKTAALCPDRSFEYLAVINCCDLI